MLNTSSCLKVLLPIKSPLTVKENNGSHPCGEDGNHKAQPLSMWRYIDSSPYKTRPFLISKDQGLPHPHLQTITNSTQRRAIKRIWRISLASTTEEEWMNHPPYSLSTYQSDPHEELSSRRLRNMKIGSTVP